jgi:hypothetical protein
MTTNNSISRPSKISTFMLAAIYITFLLSIAAIVVGVYVLTGDTSQSMEAGVALIAIGFLAMGLAGYIMFQSRKHVASLKIVTPPILTTIECRKCGIKTTREFQRGDYVYKELDKCQKCEDKQVITAIYREVTEKEKAEKAKTSNI